MLEINDLETFERWVRDNSDYRPAAIQNVDLSTQFSLIQSKSFPNSIFLACHLDDLTAGHVVMTGGVVIPQLEGYSFPVHRGALYSVDELFDGFDLENAAGYHETFDYKVYQQYLNRGKDRPDTISTSLARRLHDHSITDALEEQIEGRQVVAMMGGHSMERQSEFYTKVARISRRLTQLGFLMVSGGGPGAMEATHLGAYFAKRSDDELMEAVDILKVRPAGAKPNKEYADADWLHRAWRVREAYPLHDSDVAECQSIGIPTWLYGHEPPAVFATHIAKYFANSVREDGLLAIAKHGVIFAPGSAGTTQEIFQDAAQNHYGTQGVYSPMILMGIEHWTQVRPVWPLISSVAQGQVYGELLALTDCEDEIVRRIRMFDPELYTQ